MNELLRKLRKSLNLSQAEIEKTLELSPTTWSQYERGKVKPASDVLVKIHNKFNININWLLTGKGSMFQEQLLPVFPSDRDLIPVPLYEDLQASAGSENGICKSNESSGLTISKKLIFDKCGYIPENLCAVYVSGDSMEPTLFHGDMVIIDLSHKSLISGIYAVQFNEQLFIKRLSPLPEYKLKVISDNRNYENFEVSPQSIFRIIGKAVAFFRYENIR